MQEKVATQSVHRRMGRLNVTSTRIQRLSHIRGGEWYPENSGSRKFLFQSRNLEGVLNESRNLVFLCFFASRILEFLAARSRIFVFLANGFDQNHDKIVYLIKNVR